MSMAPCGAQSDSIQENPFLITLGKGAGKGGGGVFNNKGKKDMGEGKDRRGDERITKLKTNAISAAAERK